MRPINKVLVVEDEPDILSIIQYILEEHNAAIQLEICQTGLEAFNKAKQFKPDLILLDMMLPGVDGITILSSLKADLSIQKIPVVVMSARAQKSEIEAYYQAGALGVIPKPFDPCTLLKTIDEFRQI